jgi:hypothetical protein
MLVLHFRMQFCFAETKPIVKDSLTIIPAQATSQEIINKEVLKSKPKLY